MLVNAGNMYPSRVVLLNRLLATGIRLWLYGSPFNRWIPRTELVSCHAGEIIVAARNAAVYRAAAGVLNNLHTSELSGVNCRLFEAAGSGASVLCEDRPALAHVLVAGQLLVFSTFDELVDQARALLERPPRGTTIGDTGVVRAHAEHTYELRRITMLQTL